VVVAGQPPRAVQPRVLRSSGKPGDATRKQVWWSESAQLWVGNGVPDFKPDSNPKDYMGPFVMTAGRPDICALGRARGQSRAESRFRQKLLSSAGLVQAQCAPSKSN